MTSITLPLKKIPGQMLNLPTFFGGRKTMAPKVLLLTIPFTLYLLNQFSQEPLMSINLIGLLPYLWGCFSVTDYINKSSQVMERLIEADLDEAEKVFEKFKKYFRRSVISNSVYSISMMIILSLLLVGYNAISIYVIGMSSITSTVISLASTMSGHDTKTAVDIICLAFALKAAFLISTLKGLWQLDLIFPVAGLIILYTFLHGL